MTMPNKQAMAVHVYTAPNAATAVVLVTRPVSKLIIQRKQPLLLPHAPHPPRAANATSNEESWAREAWLLICLRKLGSSISSASYEAL